MLKTRHTYSTIPYCRKLMSNVLERLCPFVRSLVIRPNQKPNPRFRMYVTNRTRLALFTNRSSRWNIHTYDRPRNESADDNRQSLALAFYEKNLEEFAFVRDTCARSVCGRRRPHLLVHQNHLWFVSDEHAIIIFQREPTITRRHLYLLLSNHAHDNCLDWYRSAVGPGPHHLSRRQSKAVAPANARKEMERPTTYHPRVSQI